MRAFLRVIVSMAVCLCPRANSHKEKKTEMKSWWNVQWWFTLCTFILCSVDIVLCCEDSSKYKMHHTYSSAWATLTPADQINKVYYERSGSYEKLSKNIRSQTFSYQTLWTDHEKHTSYWTPRLKETQNNSKWSRHSICGYFFLLLDHFVSISGLFRITVVFGHFFCSFSVSF